VEELSGEVAEHRDKLDQLSIQQDKTAETTDRLQTAVGRIKSEIGDLPELRTTLERTATEVREEHEILEELSTLQSRTPGSMELVGLLLLMCVCHINL